MECSYYTDENIYANTNLELFKRLKHRYLPCAAIQNGNYACGNIDEFLYGDENECEPLTRKTIFFRKGIEATQTNTS
ncbi:hypothetical protein I4U23_016067 [Adineta vaga]|nr:hypothetical protein I4U23_016067 [Adineta vaga]